MFPRRSDAAAMSRCRYSIVDKCVLMIVSWGLDVEFYWGKVFNHHLLFFIYVYKGCKFH